LDKSQLQDWSGCWIGENIHGLKHDALMKRIYDADIILFYVHGMCVYILRLLKKLFINNLCNKYYRWWISYR
jgi:hypothetical protein